MDGGIPARVRRRPEQSVLHRAVREGWPEVRDALEADGGLPARVHAEVRRFLACGDVRRGFLLAACDTCADTTLVAFSCKTRGWCPSCAARRGHEAAAHLLEVLPHVAYRQWTLSLPAALRWPVVKAPKLLRGLERCLARALFRSQRRAAKQLGLEGPLHGGAVSFVQLFSSTLALQPHLHLLVPEGVFRGGTYVALPPPTQQTVEAVLKRMLQQARRAFAAHTEAWPEDAFEGLQRQGAQERLSLGDAPAPAPRGRLVAVGEGFSLHAGTHVHAHDRDALARLCRYGARGPIAEARLSQGDDGRYCYTTKKGSSLVMTGAQLVRRLLWLIPPARFHLTSFHGVFSSHAAARAAVLPAPVVPPAPRAQAPRNGNTKKRPRLDWATLHARTWGVDVWRCPCGGTRTVTALVTSRRTAEEILRNLGLLPAPLPLPPARAPPQLALPLP